MRETRLTLPEIGVIAGTRGLLGAGFGLLLAERLTESQRKTVGWTLTLIGAVSTIPLALTVLSRSSRRSDIHSEKWRRHSGKRHWSKDSTMPNGQERQHSVVGR